MTTMDALHIVAVILIFGAMWRYLTARMADRPLGQAMAFVY
jgi:hypothetical protein